MREGQNPEEPMEVWAPFWFLSAAILDNMWEALCDLSQSVVEDAVKSGGRQKRRNISGQARSLVRGQ